MDSKERLSRGTRIVSLWNDYTMQKTAQQEIRELLHLTVGNHQIVQDFDLFNSSVTQKVWSTDYYCKQLLRLDINQFQVWPSASDTQSYGSTTIQTPMLDISDYCRHLNLYLDGFFMNAMSTLDTLAHEIFTLYESQHIPNKIYINTASNMLRDNHPNSKVRALLNDQLGKPWYIDFEPFRHCTTHVSLIRHNDIIYRYDHVALQYKLSRKIKLPDNPQVRPFTYSRRKVANDYCHSLNIKLQRLVDNVYKDVLLDIHTKGNILPITTT